MSGSSAGASPEPVRRFEVHRRGPPPDVGACATTISLAYWRQLGWPVFGADRYGSTTIRTPLFWRSRRVRCDGGSFRC
jgi:hypothetical protein